MRPVLHQDLHPWLDLDPGLLAGSGGRGCNIAQLMPSGGWTGCVAETLPVMLETVQQSGLWRTRPEFGRICGGISPHLNATRSPSCVAWARFTFTLPTAGETGGIVAVSPAAGSSSRRGRVYPEERVRELAVDEGPLGAALRSGYAGPGGIPGIWSPATPRGRCG